MDSNWIQENKAILEIAFVAGIFVILIVGLFWRMSTMMEKQKRKRQAIKDAQKYVAREREKQEQEEKSSTQSGN